MGGIKRRQVHTTNVLLCRPPENKLRVLLTKINKLNREAKRAAKKAGVAPPEPIKSPIDCCAPRLEAELAPFQRFITLGGTATQAVSGATASIMAVRGGMMDLQGTERTPPRQIMPTVHPAFVLRQQRWAHVFRNDVAKAGRWFRGQAEWDPPKITYHPPADQLREFLSDPSRIYTFDIETDGIESLTAKIRCIGIGVGHEVMLCGFLGKDGVTKFYPPHEEEAVKQVLIETFANPNITKAGHNAGYYDKIVLQQQWGVTATPIIDTMLLHRNVESELPHGLAYVGSMYTEAPSWKCYDAETEILTELGWVRFPELEKGVKVAQWAKGVVSFVEPAAYVDQPYKGKVWKLENQATDLVVTPDHKMVYRPQDNAALKQCEVQDLPKTGHLPHVGRFYGKDRFPGVGFIQLIVAFQADGSWAGDAMDFGFTKKRKIDRLKGILGRMRVPFEEKQTGTVNPRTRIWVPACDVTRLVKRVVGEEKVFGSWLLGWTWACRRAFLDELPFWGGTKGKEQTNYNTTVETNADWVQAVAVITDQAARKHTYPSAKGTVPIHRVSLPGGTKRRGEWSKLDSLKRKEVDYDGRIYCVSVPSGFIIVRRNGKVTVSGNTDRDGNKLSHDSETDAQLHEYCGFDVGITARVLRPLASQVHLRNQTDVWQIDQKIQSICADMHTVGMYVDQNKRLAEEKRLLARRYALLEEIRDRLGRPDFNPGSVYQMRDILFDKWQLTAPLEDKDRFTDSGDPSTADLVLRSLLTDRSVEQRQREIIKLVRYYRKVQKVLGTYVVKLRPWDVEIESELGWDDEEDWADKETRKKYGLAKKGIVDPRTGRMHPGYNAHVAVTGRLSSSKPINAQNFPKAMRGMVIAQPGNVLVGADMDQLELRIAAARWEVQLYLNAFISGKDPHSMTAYAVFGDAFLKATGLTKDQFERPGKLVSPSYVNGKFEGTGEDKKMRDLSKAVQYASQYMAKVETVHQLICKTEVPAKDAQGNKMSDGTTDLPYALLPLKRVRKMRSNWLKGAPEFEAGWDKEISTYRRQGYLTEDVTGRRRDFLDGEAPNEIVNFPIQSSAAGLMNKALIQLAEEIPAHKWGPGTGIINQCHDSIVVECPKSEAKAVARLLEECLNQTHPSLPGVVFTASAAIGNSWKEVG